MVRLLGQRDPRVLGDLFDQYGKCAYVTIMHVVRNTATAEDLVQEAFCACGTGLIASTRRAARWGTWIQTVARHRAIDWVRSAEGRLSAGAMDLDRLDAGEWYANCDERTLSLDQARRARQLRGAIGKLTPAHQTVIELAYWEGLSQTEMAGRLGRPLGTVKTRAEEFARGTSRAASASPLITFGRKNVSRRRQPLPYGRGSVTEPRA